MQQALMYDTADLEGLEDVIFETRIVKFKNARLVPLYNRIKGLIKHLKKSDEQGLLADYEVAIAHLAHKYRGVELDTKTEKLQKIYDQLLVQIRKKAQEPANMIEDLNRKFLIFYNILQLWKEYTDTIRKGSPEIQEEMDSAPQEEFGETRIDDLDYTSPDEKMTEPEGEPDQALDFEKLKLMMRKEMRPLQEEAIAEDKRRRQENKAGNKSFNLEETTEKIEDDMNDLNEEDPVNEINKNAEMEWAESGSDPSIYGLSSNSRLTKAKDFLLRTNIEKLFPKDLVDQTFNFDNPYMDYTDIKELKENYAAFKDTEPASLNGSIFVDALLAKLERLNKTKLNDKEKQGLDDLIFLLERIGEIKVAEARLLSRLFDLV